VKVEARLFLFLTLFFAVASAFYVFASFAVYGYLEPIGITVLALSFGMTGMITFYLWKVGQKHDSRPEDDRHGEIPDGAGALGFFPPKSIWPFWCAVVLSIMVLGPVFGWWLTIFGAGLGIWAVTGWTYEFYVGDYRH